MSPARLNTGACPGLQYPSCKWQVARKGTSSAPTFAKGSLTSLGFSKPVSDGSDSREASLVSRCLGKSATEMRAESSGNRAGVGVQGAFLRENHHGAPSIWTHTHAAKEPFSIVIEADPMRTGTGASSSSSQSPKAFRRVTCTTGIPDSNSSSLGQAQPLQAQAQNI